MLPSATPGRLRYLRRRWYVAALPLHSAFSSAALNQHSDRQRNWERGRWAGQQGYYGAVLAAGLIVSFLELLLLLKAVNVLIIVFLVGCDGVDHENAVMAMGASAQHSGDSSMPCMVVSAGTWEFGLMHQFCAVYPDFPGSACLLVS